MCQSNMKEIILTKGKSTLVDDCDFDHLNQWKWSALKAKKTHYAVRGVGTQSRDGFIYMHREILGAQLGIGVDHRDKNGLNNQRENLRLATKSQNGCNRGKPSNNTSGVKGVTWDSAHNRWRSQIAVNGRTKYLGLFSDIQEAKLARDEALVKYHGEFSHIP